MRSEILGQVNDPAELEICDTLHMSATNNLADVGLPVASTIMQVKLRSIRVYAEEIITGYIFFTFLENHTGLEIILEL